MATINTNQVAADSIDALIDYDDAATALPDFSALNEAFDKFGKMVNDFFTFEMHQMHP